MKIRFHSIWLCLIPLALSVSWLGSIIHESDQASVVLGALRLVRGDAPWIGPDFYEYGNYFFSYWVLAAFYKLLPAVDLVWLGNAVSLALFWIGVAVLLFSFRPGSRSRGLAFFIALSSPAVLVHLPYFAPIFISAGFLFVGAGLLARSPRNFPWALGCWAVAFACRSDAILLVPLLAWLVADEERFSHLVRSAKSWSLVGVAIAVALAGRLLNPSAEVLQYKTFFHPDVYFAYLIFGAAGAAGLLLLLLWGLLRKGGQSKDWDQRLFWWSAAVALLIPFVFYSLLMFTTRHWVLMISAQLLLIGSGRFRLERVSEKTLLPVLAVCSAVLLFVGIRLPEVFHPQLTMTRPELFPTTDGRCPMGAIVPFMYSGRRLDHNQETWDAAQNVASWEEVNGTVPLMSFPLVDIVKLSIYSRGQRVAVPDVATPFFYISSRAVIKPKVFFDSKEQVAAAGNIESSDLRSVGGTFPASILRVERGSDVWSREKRLVTLLRKTFQGNDVRLLGVVSKGLFHIPDAAEGRGLLLWADRPFTLISTKQTFSSQCVEDIPRKDLWCVYLPMSCSKSSELYLSDSVELATTVYPDYMNIHRF